MPPLRSPRLRRLRAVAVLIGCAIVSLAAQPARRNFDLPSATAEQALKRFSQQSGVQVLFAAEITEGVRTNAVKGEFTPIEAANRLLAGTPLYVVNDEKTGVFSVARVPPETAPKNAPRAAPTASDRPGENTTGRPDEAVVMSPFEVVSDARGYYAPNTMSGTRLNSKLEDLASAISVVTKEEMSDFAMLDINDIFNYQAGTEGTGNFTDLTFNENGDPVDNTMLDPNNANRIRGIGPANISFGNFSTSGRVPLDPIDIDGVEISRGPNSNIFGLGNASGTVNSIPASPHLFRNRSQVQFRADSYDGYRGSLDLNRVVKQGVLAVRGSAVYQHDGFVRKPSGLETRRYNGMVKFQPFKGTTITAAYGTFSRYGRRANSTPPRDAISNWRSYGSPGWDPITQTAYVDGRSIGVFQGGSTGLTNPDFFNNNTLINGGGGQGLTVVEHDGSIVLWTPVRGHSGTTPTGGDEVAYRLLVTNPPNYRATQPLFLTALSVTDKAMYDWSSINIAAMNYQSDWTHTARVQIEQVFFNTPRQTLAGQVAWFREDSNSLARLFYAVPGATTTAATRANSGYLYVDPNLRLLDGTPNPYYGRTYIGMIAPITTEVPLTYDTHRAQVAYQLNLTQESGLLHWLGSHRVLGYGEYKHNIKRQYAYRDAMIDNHPWLAAGVPRANGNQPSSNGPQPYNQASPRITRGYFEYLVGDNVGQNVDYAPGTFQHGVYPFRWGSAATGRFQNEPAQLGMAGSVDFTGGPLNNNTVLKTGGLIVQSHWLRDRVVTTFGFRDDRSYVKYGPLSSLLPDGQTHDYAWDNQWVGDWQSREGRTNTRGFVVKALPWVSLHYNQSESFKPAPPAQDLHLRPLADPGGEGRDYGISFNFLEGKLRLKINRYTTDQINSRNGNSTTFARNVKELDVYGGSQSRPFGLDVIAGGWITRAAAKNGQTLTPDQVADQLSKITGLSPAHLRALEDLSSPLAETDNLKARGTEVELYFNPTRYWTLKANATQQEVFTSSIAPDLTAWLAERLPIWMKIVDPETNQPWWTSAYGGATPKDYIERNVLTQFALAKQLEGKSQSQIRKYRWNVSSNYRLAGLLENRFLKRINVGGSLRWESRGGIGYYGVQKLPAIITDLDPNNPIWDKAHVYADAFIGYRTRLFSDKVEATFQLNARNLQEGGRLQPVSALPDGTPNAYRIVDPRQYILSATFAL